MKVTKSYIKQLVKEELNKELSINEVFTPVERSEGESEEDFKMRRRASRDRDQRKHEREYNLSGYKMSEAAKYAFQVALEAGAVLGFSTGDYSQGSADTGLNNAGDKARINVQMGRDTVLTIEEPIENERVLGVVVSTFKKGMQEKMEEIMGSNPRFAIRFVKSLGY